MAHFPASHPVLKATGITISVGAAAAFLAFAFGASHNDWTMVASFIAVFVGVVVFLFGWMMK